MKYYNVIKKEFKTNLEVVKQDIENAKDKEFFKYNGTQIYTGFQGSGKTISAVKNVIDILKEYPKSILVSNIILDLSLYGIENKVYYFYDIKELSKLLKNVNNDKYGVIYLIDEIQTFFNALDSMNIPIYIFTEISQQRKQRKLIIGTSQLFLRVAKPFREQCDNIIVCKTYLNKFTFNKVYRGTDLNTDKDGNITAVKLKWGWFMQTVKLRSVYDTYQVVVSGVNNSLVETNIKKRD